MEESHRDYEKEKARRYDRAVRYEKTGSLFGLMLAALQGWGMAIWTAFMALYYTGTALADWDAFWIWFPLWIVPAVSLGIVLAGAFLIVGSLLAGAFKKEGR